MSGIQTTLPPKAAPKPGLEGNGASQETVEAQVERIARDADKVMEKAADASGDAARANREILHRNAQTAQDFMRTGLETGVQSLHTLADTMSRSFGMNDLSPELAEQSARNVRAVSEASTALARGTQEASRVWLALIQSGVRANLEAFRAISGCRTFQDFAALQSRFARDNLQLAIESGEQLTRASGEAISTASRAIKADDRKTGAPA